MIIDVENISFSYGKETVLDDISFFAEKNSIVSVLGSNGAGKTTMLKCMCNVLRPQKGAIHVEGKDVLKMKARELARHIAYVPQSVATSRMTVFDAVLIGRRPHIEINASKNDIAITTQAINDMGLEKLSLRYLDQLSGGEFQKVQIARALAQETDILILDEPSNNLDIANQHKTMNTVEKIVRKKGVSAIITMHDINLAIQYSDKFLFMKDGKVSAYGGQEIITEQLIQNVYGIKAEIILHNNLPVVIPFKH
ncbi:MAG: ABC transporter ATP-binding protein [Spirochaetales bacterium]|nr:ABC transporter ATP-binding protein [Spirochaetales bacterium]